jgi:seryl-tRNA synthetase
MLDLKFIRENPEAVRQAIENRCIEAPLDEILKLDAERREKLTELENLRRTRKMASKDFQAGQDAVNEGRERRVRVKDLEDDTKRLDEELTRLVLQIPNIPQPSVPLGKSERDNVVMTNWREPKVFDFTPATHWEIGEKLGIIDFERGVKLAGTRFYVLTGDGARLQRAIINFMLDLHTNEHGYTDIYPPFMVKKDVMTASGNLPKFADNLYHDAEDDLWFIPTAEVPLTSMYADEVLPPGSLPVSMCAYTPCFRREKMSAGKDTRGIKRGHQFDKIELYKIVEPEKSNEELEKLLHDACDVAERLELPYHILRLCTADLGFSSSKTYDIEVWAPGCSEWLEVSSCSNCWDFQARRANIRYRPTTDSRPMFPHTLNGSGLALPRILIAIIENYQQKDGTIAVPEVLRPYMGKSVIK